MSSSVIFGVRQPDLRERRLPARDDLLRRPLAGKQLPAQRGKREIAPSGHHVIGELADALRIGLVAHFGPADDDDRPPARPLSAARRGACVSSTFQM